MFQEAPQLGPHKVILVGDSGVGKSSFMLRLCDDAFNEKMNPSFGKLSFVHFQILLFRPVAWVAGLAGYTSFTYHVCEL